MAPGPGPVPPPSCRACLCPALDSLASHVWQFLDFICMPAPSSLSSVATAKEVINVSLSLMPQPRGDGTERSGREKESQIKLVNHMASFVHVLRQETTRTGTNCCTLCFCLSTLESGPFIPLQHRGAPLPQRSASPGPSNCILSPGSWLKVKKPVASMNNTKNVETSGWRIKN